MLSLLFFNKTDMRIISEKSVLELELKELFASNTLDILTRKCSKEEILARQAFFKQMDDKVFFDGLSNLNIGLKALERQKNNLQAVNNKTEYYFCFLNYIKEYKKVIDASGFLMDQDLRLVGGLKNVLETVMASLPELEQQISRYEGIIAEYKKLVLSGNGQIGLFANENDLSSKLLYIAEEMGLDIGAYRKNKNRSIPEAIADDIIDPNAQEGLNAGIERIKGLINEDIYCLISELDFYFSIYSLKKKANELNIPACFAALSDKPCFMAENLFNISLIDTVGDKIVPNDAAFKENKNFFVLTGANSGGKTSYLKAIAINLLLFLGGCPVFCSKAEIYPFSHIFTHFCSDEKKTENGSFNDEYQSIKELADNVASVGDGFVLLNEPLTTTDSAKAEELIYDLIYSFYKKGHFGLLITHFHSVANKDIPALRVVVDSDNGDSRTYKIEDGSESRSYAADILKKYKLDEKSLGC